MDRKSFPKKHLNSMFGGILVMTAVLLLPMTLPVFADGIAITSSASNPECAESNTCFSFFEVKAGIGQEITWTNNDAAAHTITSGPVDDGPDDTFDSGLILSGDSFSHIFTDAGTYDYFCSIHPWMTGTVVIQ